MKRFSYWQIAAVAALLLSYTTVSLVAKPGFALSAFSDITNFSLWIVAVGAMLWAAFSNRGRTRIFWFLLAVGGAMVGTNLGAWFVEEVILRKSPPEPFWADIPLFLQPVPMMAAAAMRPGSRQEVQRFYLSTLNFAILVFWWVYIYAFLIFPNEYIVFNKLFFNRYYYTLFVMESAVLLAIMGGMAMVAEGAWRKIYWNLFFAGSMYLLAFQWLNAALERNDYYSGSLYDVPNIASISFFILIAINARNVPAEALSGNARERRRTDVPGMLAAMAVLSMPVVGLCELYLGPHFNQLLPYRVSVTLVAILVVGICVYLRQRLMTNEMTRVLFESEQNFERLHQMQSQLLQKERLAGVGQLVSGVAHELNNPLTAVMGYSDLLRDQAAEGPERHKLDRLGTEARRMKRIIDNLISFARPPQEGRRELDISVIVRESQMLCEYQLRRGGIAVKLDFPADLPRVSANEGQLKQVFVNLFTNAVQALEQTSEKKVRIEGGFEAGRIVIHFCDSGPGFLDLTRVFDPFYTTRPVGQGTGLGLSICYGFIREHGGRISVKNIEPNGASVTIELPAVGEATPSKQLNTSISQGTQTQ
jgi:signal transduction histidine kinase